MAVPKSTQTKLGSVQVRQSIEMLHKKPHSYISFFQMRHPSKFLPYYAYWEHH